MRTDGNYGGAPAYSPNSMGDWAAQPDVMEPPLDLSGAMYAYDPQDDPTDDCFRAGGDLWRVLTEDKRELFDRAIPQEILLQSRRISNTAMPFTATGPMKIWDPDHGGHGP